jgi:hypothetical protein
MDEPTIASIEAEFSEGLPRPVSLERMARNWHEVAEEVGRGYVGSIDDYTHDLWSRGVLQRAIDRLNSRDRSWLQELVAPADQRFREATREAVDDRISRYIRHDDHWWWKRVPLVMGDLEPYF